MNTTIIALADSHTTSMRTLPSALVDAVAAADIIIHAGDHTEMSLLEELRELGRVIAVAGNMDSLALKLHLPHRTIFQASGKSIGVTHGAGPPVAIAQRVLTLFPEKPDAIVFGHSHNAFCGLLDGVLMINPGPAAQGYARIRAGSQIAAQLVSL